MIVDEIENWKAVKGYEGFYEVSNQGRVRSLDRMVGSKGLSKRLHRGKVLSSSVHHGGYVQVGLCVGGKQVNHLVHRLVLMAFRGDPVGDEEGCHRDGVRTNNRLSNLRWDTPIGNAADKPSNSGVDNPNARLTADDVLTVMKLHKDGVSQVEISIRLSISVATVNHITTGRTWSSLTGVPYTKKHATVDQALVDRMASMKRDGKTLDEIANELKVGKATVFRNYRKGALS